MWDASLFDLEGDARLIADLREATTDIAGQAEPPTAAELKQAVANTPRLARQFPGPAPDPSAAWTSG